LITLDGSTGREDESAPGIPMGRGSPEVPPTTGKPAGKPDVTGLAKFAKGTAGACITSTGVNGVFVAVLKDE